MYSVWQVMDESEGLDAFSTVVQATKPPPKDWPHIIGWTPIEDEPDHYLVAWTVPYAQGTVMGTSKQLWFTSSTTFRCPKCRTDVHLTDDACINCGWEVPESFSDVTYTFNYEHWHFYNTGLPSPYNMTEWESQLDHACMVSHEPIGHLDAARNLIEAMLTVCGDPHSLVKCYGPYWHVMNNIGIFVAPHAPDYTPLANILDNIQHELYSADIEAEDIVDVADWRRLYSLLGRLCLGLLNVKVECSLKIEPGKYMVLLDTGHYYMLAAGAEAYEGHNEAIETIEEWSNDPPYRLVWLYNKIIEVPLEWYTDVKQRLEELNNAFANYNPAHR